MARTIDQITQEIIGAAIQVHRELGPGLLESAYEACLAFELLDRGLTVEQQKPLLLRYRGLELDCAYRLDLLVEQKVIVEVKSVEKLLPLHDAQLLSYLRIAQCPVGLLLNFNVAVLTQGLHRLANNHREGS
ncbi:MAG: GxxExxY protein [Thermomicrobiales bacterium]